MLEEGLERLSLFKGEWQSDTPECHSIHFLGVESSANQPEISWHFVG